MRQCIRAVAAGVVLYFAVTNLGSAQILEVGTFENVELEGIVNFDEVAVRSGGTLIITGNSTLRILGDFQVEGADPTDEDISAGLVFIRQGVRGTQGSRGADGSDGANGNSIVPDGQGGTPGGDGGDGTDGVSDVNTLRINTGGDILIDGRIRSGRVSGGVGGSGGEGGFGGDGLNRQFSGIASGPGGDGGPGGSGGNGGDAGLSEGPIDLFLNALGAIVLGPDAEVSLNGRDGARGGGADEGGDGGDGGHATLGSGFNGGDGARGGAGGNGGAGASGTRGGDARMMAPTIQLFNTFTHPVLGENLAIFMPGGDGADGGSGAEGGDGGSGGQAGSFAGFGGRGGNGARGGNGGDGGDGTRGGDLALRGVEVLLAVETTAPFAQSGGFGGSAGSGGRGGNGGSGGFGGTDFQVQAPNGLDGSDGSAGSDGEDGADGVIDVTLLDDGRDPDVGNGDFSNGLAFFVELGEGTASIVQVNDDPALQMSVDVGALSLTQIVGTNGADGLQVDLDYAFLTPAGTLEVLLDGNLILGITPTGVTSPVATPTVTPGAPFNHVSLVCPVPVVADSFHELSLRLLPGSPAMVQVDNLALQPAALTVPVEGDIDGDGDVDVDDIGIILAARNQPADGADDPRDLDGDGVITVLDARIAATLCTRPSCATG